MPRSSRHHFLAIQKTGRGTEPGWLGPWNSGRPGQGPSRPQEGAPVLRHVKELPHELPPPKGRPARRRQASRNNPCETRLTQNHTEMTFTVQEGDHGIEIGQGALVDGPLAPRGGPSAPRGELSIPRSGSLPHGAALPPGGAGRAHRGAAHPPHGRPHPVSGAVRALHGSLVRAEERVARPVGPVTRPAEPEGQPLGCLMLTKIDFPLTGTILTR
jgi:hypothetical protein